MSITVRVHSLRHLHVFYDYTSWDDRPDYYATLTMYMCVLREREYDEESVRVEFAACFDRAEFDHLPAEADVETYLAGRINALGLAAEVEQRVLQEAGVRIVYRFAYE